MSKLARILVVDDDELIRDVSHDILHLEGYLPTMCSSAEEARKAAAQKHYDLLITDLNMPKESGEELIAAIRKQSKTTGIIVMTGFPDEEKVRRMEELGVSAFLTKPFTAKQLKFSVIGALEAHKTLSENDRIKAESSENCDYGLVGVSDYIKKIRQHIKLLGSGDFPALIFGESGTGKEIVAQAIHAASYRQGLPMITINCAAIPHHLEESEFFGYVRGAFTGANTTKLGILESANNSTIFLDEIGELSLPVQAKLLRVLDNGQYIRIGETNPRSVDIRILSATNRDLETMVREGTFRKDLYFRLKGGVITTEPLCRHPEDIPHLIHHFLALHGNKKQLTNDAMALFSEYPWPGNVRELRHTMNHLISASRGQRRINSDSVRMILKIDHEEAAIVSYHAAKSAFERSYFLDLFHKYNGTMSRMAVVAGLHRPNLIRKCKELGIAPTQDE